MVTKRAVIIGAGLAGSEAAWQLAERGVDVRLIEMRPQRMTPAHRTDRFAELVCSNSFKSAALPSAAATLKAELTLAGSLLMQCARDSQVRAGSALAVDRDRFSALVTTALSEHTRIKIIRCELHCLSDARRFSDEAVIVATGPLTSDALSASIAATLGGNALSFYDAAAPIVMADSLNSEILFAQSRYSNEGGDYLNAPLSREHYECLIDALLAAKRVRQRDFEQSELFSACQPIEEVARSGRDAPRFGALKPVGISDPTTGRRPWAVVQLRAENAQRSAYNLVGFQTNLTFAEQQRVFRLIPGLEQAEFARFGVMHRNSFLDTPRALGPTLEHPRDPLLRFAGQLTGTEGYSEAVASGLYTALASYAALAGLPAPTLPPETTFGALLAYATDPATRDYQPMHVNYGLMMPLVNKPKRKQARYEAYSTRALAAAHASIAARPDLWPPAPSRLAQGRLAT
jgi:methylenetetrahydrofolate--tRNA-(uracil-5-)-methyltransferase